MTPPEARARRAILIAQRDTTIAQAHRDYADAALSLLDELIAEAPATEAPKPVAPAVMPARRSPKISTAPGIDARPPESAPDVAAPGTPINGAAYDHSAEPASEDALCPHGIAVDACDQCLF